MSELSVPRPFNRLLCSSLMTSDGGNAEKTFTLLEFGAHSVSKFNSLGALSSFLHDIKLQFIQQDCKKRRCGYLIFYQYKNDKILSAKQSHSNIGFFGVYLNRKLSNDEEVQIMSKKSEEFIMIKLRKFKNGESRKIMSLWLKNAGSYISQEA